MDSLLGFFRLSWALGSFFGSRSLPLELWAGATFTFLGFSEQSESSRGGTFPVALSRTELHFSFLYKYIYM